MTAFTIEVKDHTVQDLLAKLAGRAGGLRPVLDSVGVKLVERTQRRFDTGKAPDGTPWAAYPAGGATLTMLAARIGGFKSKRKKDGSLNARGQREFAGKQLLVGESKHLKNSIAQVATDTALVLSSSMAYAAIHQFGGITGAASWIPGKAIPARPFLPIQADKTLYPQERELILQELNAFLLEGL